MKITAQHPAATIQLCSKKRPGSRAAASFNSGAAIVTRRYQQNGTRLESIQAGLYHGNIAVLRHLCGEVRAQYFAGKPTVLVGTGGFARLFEEEKIFDAYVPELVLIGLREALALNT